MGNLLTKIAQLLDEAPCRPAPQPLQSGTGIARTAPLPWETPRRALRDLRVKPAVDSHVCPVSQRHMAGLFTAATRKFAEKIRKG